MHVNNWLWRWCQQQGFGFYDNGTLFEDQRVLGKDGIHLAKQGKGIFASRMADLVRTALN